MKILLINLVQSQDRLEEQKKQFTQLGLEFERLNAVTIDDFSAEEYQKKAFSGQRPLKQSELACFLSHQKAWQYAYDNNTTCLILEDDVVLVKDLKLLLEYIDTLEAVDFINLEVHGRRKIVADQAKYDVPHSIFKLYRLFQDRSGAAAYILFPSGAKKLLDFTQQRAIGLADEFINSCNALVGYQIEPTAALQSDKCTMYAVNTSMIHHSMIAAVENKQNIELNQSEKIKFKQRRIKRQLQLGWLNLKNSLKGTKREIEVNPKLF